MNDLLKNLIALQKIDSSILEKRIFIDKVPKRIFEVDAPLKQAKSELETIKQKNETFAKKKTLKEGMLEDIHEKIRKMKSRVSEIKTNKEYQAHLKEIESNEKEIDEIEEQILVLMEELDDLSGIQSDKEEKVRIEEDRIEAFKQELDKEVKKYETELMSLQDEREKVLSSIDTEYYDKYMKLLDAGAGIAVTRAESEICLGCNMNVPPQLFVELKKNEEIIQCPQCYRILYYSEAI